MDLRLYSTVDRPACLALFDSNTPDYFAPAERAEFDSFLTHADPATYLVGTLEGRPIACGGIVRHGTAASLAWGMVARSHHRQGLGTALLLARIKMAQAMPAITSLTLGTSQKSSAFYARFGFRPVRTVPDGYGPGLDRIDMTLTF